MWEVGDAVSLSPTTSVRYAELAIKHLFARAVLTRPELVNFKLDSVVEAFSDNLVFTALGMVASQGLIGPLHIQYPDGWVQSLWERFAPAWALRRWPVRYVEHDIEVFDIYPEIVIDPMRYGPSVRVVVHNGETLT